MNNKNNKEITRKEAIKKIGNYFKVTLTLIKWIIKKLQEKKP